MSALRDDKAKFDSRRAVIFGVNPGSLNSHSNFSHKNELNFPLLIDGNREVAHAYSVLKENGKSIQRAVIIVDEEGRVSFAKEGMPPNEEILAALGPVGT